MVIVNCNSEEFIITTKEIKYIVLYAPVLEEDETFVSFAIGADNQSNSWVPLYRLTWSIEAVNANRWEHFDKTPENVGFYEKGTEAVVLFDYSRLKEYEYIYLSSQ